MKIYVFLLSVLVASAQQVQRPVIPATPTTTPPLRTSEGIPAGRIDAGSTPTNAAAPAVPTVPAAELTAMLRSTQAQIERAHATISAFLETSSLPVQTAPHPADQAAGSSTTSSAQRPFPAAGAVPPPSRFLNPVIISSGEDLSAAAGNNASTRVSGNLSANTSVPAGGAPPQVQPPQAAVAPADPTMAPGTAGAQPSAGGLAVTPEVTAALELVKQDFERLLPVLAALNGTAPGFTNGSPHGLVPPSPVGRPSGRPAPPGNLRIQQGPR